ncbi:MAG: DUF853 family protein [Marinilabiliaceae bacterium]|nr:DUF853 family protein [Marinilabiliaceae bacterium]
MYTEENELYIANHAGKKICMVGKMSNRHGLIAGATGTGKTVTLQVIAETFGQAGVPCFMADMKGDLSGISQVGSMTKFIESRKDEFGVPNPEFSSCPVRFFDVFGEQGHPLRTRVCDMGAQLMARLMELNETQTGVLTVVFKIASDEQMPIVDLKDLRSLLDYVGQNAKQYTTNYGNISATSIGAIQRSLMTLEAEGADKFFGEPAFHVEEFIKTIGGKGVMNILAADKLMLKPKMYSTFLLWMMTSLYETLPEVGDMELPKLIFFFDEAHMLFEDTSKALADKIEQIVRLIRSKGVGIYFISQSPMDIPEDILGQLGNRVQHALRAYTPKDQKAVKTAAATFRANPEFKTEDAIMELETGEALISFLDEKGAPSIVERCKVLFPLSQIGAITPEQRRQFIERSDIYGKYEDAIDSRSAFEILHDKREDAAANGTALTDKERAKKEKEDAKLAKEQERLEKAKAKEEEKKRKEKEKRNAKIMNTVVKTATSGTVLKFIGKFLFGK